MIIHAFFQTILLKGAVLGVVNHFYWKKKYQARVAPHYLVLLWICDALVINRDDPEKVLTFIQERIACHIPNEETNPGLLACNKISDAGVQCVLQAEKVWQHIHLQM